MFKKTQAQRAFGRNLRYWCLSRTGEMPSISSRHLSLSCVVIIVSASLIIQLCYCKRKRTDAGDTKCVKNQTQDGFQNWKPGFNWYCSTVIILKGIVWSNTCNVSTHSSLSYRIIGLSFCIEQYIQCEINTFTQMDIIVGAHLYDTRHKNIQVIVFFFPFTDVKHI